MEGVSCWLREYEEEDVPLGCGSPQLPRMKLAAQSFTTGSAGGGAAWAGDGPQEHSLLLRSRPEDSFLEGLVSVSRG